MPQFLAEQVCLLSVAFEDGAADPARRVEAGLSGQQLCQPARGEVEPPGFAQDTLQEEPQRILVRSPGCLLGEFDEDAALGLDLNQTVPRQAAIDAEGGFEIDAGLGSQCPHRRQPGARSQQTQVDVRDELVANLLASRDGTLRFHAKTDWTGLGHRDPGRVP